ncbi:hypothetical protein P692DRAFT_201136073 [Suillus brevipes Sb2]|nr:hypothetical protein P692DRAFT_201136073 [Suillus brevipes Sb2]
MHSEGRHWFLSALAASNGCHYMLVAKLSKVNPRLYLKIRNLSRHIRLPEHTFPSLTLCSISLHASLYLP